MVEWWEWGYPQGTISDGRADPQTPPTDTDTRDGGLICPNCEYNLTGLPEHRCPECGEEFDVDELSLIAAGVPMPATSWDRQRTFRAFCETWWLSLTAPRRLAQHFPARHDAGLAVGYSFGCYALGAIAFALLWLGFVVKEGALELLRVIPAVALGASFVCSMCETATAGILAALVKPTRATQRYHFWRGFTHYTSGYAVLTGLWGGVGVLLASDLVRPEAVTVVVYMVFGACIFCWWVLALCRMIVRRSPPGPGGWVAYLVVPVVGIVAIPIGYVVVAVLRLLCVFP